MQASTRQKFERIKRVSAILRLACKVFVVLVTLLFVIAIGAVLLGGDVTLALNRARIPAGAYTLPWRLFMAGLLVLTMGVVLKGIYHLHSLFGNYAAGHILTTQAAAQMRNLGITAILWCLINIVWAVTIASLRVVAGPFDPRLDALAGGVALIAISWFIDAAAELRAENELTI